MESNTAPINMPASGVHDRRESAFLSLSPLQSSASPPKASNTALHDKKAATSVSADSSAMSAIISSNTNDTAGAAEAAPADAVSKTRRSSSVDSDGSGISDKTRFLKLGHAQAGEHALGDFSEE